MMDAVAVDVVTDVPIGVAVLAMGGQGGGVLADWIVALAEAAGWTAQSTSVPGVAQRTGATIYYVEMIRARPGRVPVLSLMPVPGEVDVVIAAELMEAGRAMQRGLVSDRTVLIASSHRSFAVTEKASPGNGIADPAAVLDAAHSVAARFLAADMQRLADKAGSVISASLFGALAGSGALPFARVAFEETIRAAGVGVEASLRAFSAGFDAVAAPRDAAPAAVVAAAPRPVGGTAADRKELAGMLARIDRFPEAARPMLLHGVRRLVDYQDIAYATEYLDRVAGLAELDPSGALATEAAKQVAVAMAYDDVLRVADLKTRGARRERVLTEAGARPGQVVQTTEFMHPRVAEICGSLPAPLGRAVEGSPALSRMVRVLFERGRRVRTHTVLGFGTMYLIAGARRWRRGLLRHSREQAHLDAWLALVRRHAATDVRLGVEILKCRRLVKGYGDTHARGASKFDRVLGALPLLAVRPDGAEWLRRLREAALADEAGEALDGALRTVASL